MEFDSIYVRVHISPQQFEKWLASPMRHMHDFNDWNEMTTEWEEGWEDDYYSWDYKTIRELIDVVEKESAVTDDNAITSPPFIHYDRTNGVFTYAQLLFDENFINFMLDISAYRTIAGFKDTDEPDFLVIYPYLWDPGYTVIMEIGRGYTKFHSEESVPAQFQEFIDAANAHFDTEVEQMHE